MTEKKKMYDLGVFIFRRDLRLDDNHGLLRLLGECKTVMPIFCLDENQVVENDRNRQYFSPHAVQFMCESLKDLNSQLEVRFNSRLRLFFGLPWISISDFLADLKRHNSAMAVGWNADYSRYSKYRDSEISKVCAKLQISTVVTDTDLLIRPMAEYEKRSPGAFKQFSPFWGQAQTNKPELPVTLSDSAGFSPASIDFKSEFGVARLAELYKENAQLAQRGGRSEAQKKLSNLKKFRDYSDKRDFLSYSSTNLSAALNFGCVSIREVYWAIVNTLGKDSELIRQLYWRDFLHQMAVYDVEANNYARHIDARFDRIAWRTDAEAQGDWEALMAGRTGYLIIDAAVMEMKTTGFVGNRARMVLGNAWVKHLRINPLHPRYGVQVGYSRYFVDAVGCTQNKLNCQWLTELDFAGRRYAAPGVPLSGRMMDINNKQLKKWDPDCGYVKKWLPHLKGVPNEYLFDWDEATSKKFKGIHPGPIFDSKKRLEEWVEACRGL